MTKEEYILLVQQTVQALEDITSMVNLIEGEEWNTELCHTLCKILDPVCKKESDKFKLSLPIHDPRVKLIDLYDHLYETVRAVRRYNNIDPERFNKAFARMIEVCEEIMDCKQSIDYWDT